MKAKPNKFEQETIINFNGKDRMASIFTYSKRWQNHLETKLGIKPVLINDHWAREYLIEKDRIKLPRAKRVVTETVKQNLMKRLKNNVNPEQEKGTSTGENRSSN